MQRPCYTTCSHVGQQDIQFFGQNRSCDLLVRSKSGVDIPIVVQGAAYGAHKAGHLHFNGLISGLDAGRQGLALSHNAVDGNKSAEDDTEPELEQDTQDHANTGYHIDDIFAGSELLWCDVHACSVELPFQ